jgi:hypothetical protein
MIAKQIDTNETLWQSSIYRLANTSRRRLLDGCLLRGLFSTLFSYRARLVDVWDSQEFGDALRRSGWWNRIEPAAFGPDNQDLRASSASSPREPHPG